MLIQMIEKHFPQVQLLSFPRKNFDDKDDDKDGKHGEMERDCLMIGSLYYCIGLAYIRKFGFSENVVPLIRALSAK